MRLKTEWSGIHLSRVRSCRYYSLDLTACILYRVSNLNKQILDQALSWKSLLCFRIIKNKINEPFHLDLHLWVATFHVSKFHLFCFFWLSTWMNDNLHKHIVVFHYHHPQCYPILQPLLKIYFVVLHSALQVIDCLIFPYKTMFQRLITSVALRTYVVTKTVVA